MNICASGSLRTDTGDGKWRHSNDLCMNAKATSPDPLAATAVFLPLHWTILLAEGEVKAAGLLSLCSYDAHSLHTGLCL